MQIDMIILRAELARKREPYSVKSKGMFVISGELLAAFARMMWKRFNIASAT